MFAVRHLALQFVASLLECPGCENVECACVVATTSIAAVCISIKRFSRSAITGSHVGNELCHPENHWINRLKAVMECCYAKIVNL